MSTARSVRLGLAVIFGLLAAGVGTVAALPAKPQPAYGKCHDCSCPGFQGTGYTCTRGGCKHHYDRHY
jgi:hypothetical protein